MPAPRLLVPLRPLALRALVVYVGVRSLLLVASAILQATGGEPIDNPVGIIILCAALGVVDLRRRHETLLWANLGYPTSVIAGLFGAVAVLGESLWALR